MMWCHRWRYLLKHTALVVSYCVVSWQLTVCQELFCFPKLSYQDQCAIQAHNSLNIVVKSTLIYTLLVAASLSLVGPEIKSVEEARKLHCWKILRLRSQRGYCWWNWLLIKSYLPIWSQSRTSLTVISTCPVIYFLTSPVWQTKFWRICISHAMILKKFPLFPSEGNVSRPQYPSRLRQEVSWSQISCFSFSQKMSQTPYIT